MRIGDELMRGDDSGRGNSGGWRGPFGQNKDQSNDPLKLDGDGDGDDEDDGEDDSRGKRMKNTYYLYYHSVVSNGAEWLWRPL